jgi:putative membrane protein
VLADAAAVAAQFEGTMAMRPYVIAFLAAYLLVASRDLGLRRALAWLAWGFGVAVIAEYSSTRGGFPFGLYHYTGHTMGRELFVSNVPAFSPLSFPFLAYASWCVVRWVRGRPRDLTTLAAAGVVMMVMDVVVDPLAVVGHRWFLGDLFFYPDGGLYLGVPLSNFAGWVLVGWVIAGGAVLTGFFGLERGGRPVNLGSPRGGAALYYGILLFNLTIAVWIGEIRLAVLGAAAQVTQLLILAGMAGRERSDRPPRWAAFPAPMASGMGDGRIER